MQVTFQASVIWEVPGLNLRQATVVLIQAHRLCFSLPLQADATGSRSPGYSSWKCDKDNRDTGQPNGLTSAHYGYKCKLHTGHIGFVF